jgi:hypothetical protein
MHRDIDLREELAQSKLADGSGNNYKMPPREGFTSAAPNQKTASGKLCMTLAPQAAWGLGASMSAFQFTAGALRLQ